MEIDGNYGPRLPADLTLMRSKADLFAVDSLFWEGWEDLEATAGAAAAQLAHDHTLILLKPDAVVTRNVHIALEWLQDAGFIVTYAERVELHRAQIRLLWQYQWNIARRERKDACDLLLTAGPSLLVIARKPAHVSEPATAHFARLKGPADPSLREPGQLRHLLGKRSTLLNFIHSADEPADLPREAAILLDAQGRERAFAAMRDRSDAGPTALALATKLYAELPPHDLKFDPAMARLRSTSAGSDTVAAWLSDYAASGHGDWRELFHHLDQAGLQLQAWDRITLAAHLIVMDNEDYKLLIPGLKLIEANDRRVAGSER